MKKTNLLTGSLKLSLIILIVFGSCKKDELVSKELLVFLKGDYGTVNSTIAASLTRTPTAVWGNKVFDIPAYATREVTADIDVSIFPDESLIAQYNQANGTNYLPLPNTSYKFNTAYIRRINAGSLVSEPFTVELIDASVLTDTKGYILPITIKSLDGKDKGAKISTNQGTVYLTIPYKYTNVDSVQTALTGTLMTRTGWTVTVSNSTSGTANQASNMLDGNNSTVWRSSNSATAAKTVTLNLGSVQQVSSFRFSPNYTNTGENPTQITVSTSNDNVTFTPQGIWRGTGPASGSSATTPDFKGINFIVPVQARYFKFDINAWVSTNVVGVAEINANQ